MLMIAPPYRKKKRQPPNEFQKVFPYRTLGLVLLSSSLSSVLFVCLFVCFLKLVVCIERTDFQLLDSVLGFFIAMYFDRIFAAGWPFFFHGNARNGTEPQRWASEDGSALSQETLSVVMFTHVLMSRKTNVWSDAKHRSCTEHDTEKSGRGQRARRRARDERERERERKKRPKKPRTRSHRDAVFFSFSSSFPSLSMRIFLFVCFRFA